MLPPRVAAAVCHPSTLPGETLDPGHRLRGKTLPGDAEVQWERDTSTPGAPPREDGSFPGRHPGTVYRRTYPAWSRHPDRIVTCTRPEADTVLISWD